MENLASHELAAMTTERLQAATFYPWAASNPPLCYQHRHRKHMYRCIMTKAAIGKPAPEFSCKAIRDGDFADIKLSDFRGKYVVLFFYPGDFTFVCPTEIIAFSDRAAEFEEIETQVMACSTDSAYTHFAWISQPRKLGGLGDMQIPVLSDKTMAISRDYGVLKEDEGMAYRGLFIIDRSGVIRQITINDMPVGRSVDETLRLVNAFQFVDKHGEVCPAGWTPGKKGMKADTKGAKEYFEAANTEENGHTDEIH